MQLKERINYYCKTFILLRFSMFLGLLASIPLCFMAISSDFSQEGIGIDELKEKAIEFSEEMVGALGLEYSNEIYVYISKVIEDKSFQENPQLYMEQWIERRGWTKEFRVAEDSAISFFTRVLE